MVNMKHKHPRESRISTMKIVAPEHLNAHGTLFGGYLMCWVDEIAYMAARKYSGNSKCVTAHIENISFKTASNVGHHVLLEAQVIYVGQSSMDILVRVRSEANPSADALEALEACLTFVALGEDGRPRKVPRLVPETRDEERLHYQAQLRRKVRDRFDRYLARAAGKALPNKPAVKQQSARPSRGALVRLAEKSKAQIIRQIDRVVPWV